MWSEAGQGPIIDPSFLVIGAAGAEQFQQTQKKGIFQ
jgi:hypothetical protein